MKVRAGEGAVRCLWAAAARLFQAPAPSPRRTSAHTINTVNGPGRAEECKALDAHITQLDAQAHQL